MKAVRYHRHGDHRVLEVENLQEPEVGPGQVLVRLASRGINRSELLTVAGTYPRLQELPAIPGREGAGEVVAVGEGVSTVRVGDRVALRLGASLEGGTWCELVRARATDVDAVPEHLDTAEAGAVTVSYLTALGCLRTAVGLRAGSVVVVTAASSPAGLAALQLCRHFGILAIATTRRPERVEVLRESGAWRVVVTTRDDLVREVRRHTDGRGADGAVDAVGGEVGHASFRALAEEGTLVQYGALSGGRLAVNPGSLIYGRRKVRGFWLTRQLELASPAERDQTYRELWHLVRAARLRPRVHRAYPLDEVQRAVRDLEEMAHLGKVVLA